MRQLRFERILDEAQIGRTSRLAAEIWPEHYLPIIGRAQVEYMLETFQSAAAIRRQIGEGYEYYLAFYGAAAAGYFALRPRGAELFLSKLYLAPPWRGRGCGKACFDFILERARALNLPAIVLTVNKNNSAAIAAYERWGCERVRGLVSDIGAGFVMDDWEYRYTL